MNYKNILVISAFYTQKKRKEVLKIEFEIDLPEEYQKYFEYLRANFKINIKEYLESIIECEIKSRNEDLGLFN